LTVFGPFTALGEVDIVEIDDAFRGKIMAIAGSEDDAR
jgi:hypothetical protein